LPMEREMKDDRSPDAEKEKRGEGGDGLVCVSKRAFANRRARGIDSIDNMLRRKKSLRPRDLGK